MRTILSNVRQLLAHLEGDTFLSTLNLNRTPPNHVYALSEGDLADLEKAFDYLSTVRQSHAHLESNTVL
jgi:hypothetical protein